ncbi:conserved protein of unknown function [Magnetospirillum sp. XM-1]|uniref:hypothetical protein n=1 Tax=Magnetospirillum sp. XM-1 TaxID=1663591 RepID=UPI00073DF298|nr:hypothetical protein [Magnetospirillum sp. XM-1]CUW37398.1 conserved protein of unknown function [Magnetospirillum sp. XM-1]
MFGFLKNLFADEKPKPKARPKPAATKPPSPPSPKADPGSERAALLKRAQEVHRAKRKILDHLSDEDRAKLVSMAILTFLNQGREPDDKKR